VVCEAAGFTTAADAAANPIVNADLRLTFFIAVPVYLKVSTHALHVARSGANAHQANIAILRVPLCLPTAPVLPQEKGTSARPVGNAPIKITAFARVEEGRAATKP
jgi:hypothetical protein